MNTRHTGCLQVAIFNLIFLLIVSGYQNVSLAQPASSLRGNWPGFLGSRRNGISTETGILRDWSSGKLELLWKIESVDGYPSGVAVDQRYYHFDAVDGQGRLRCVDVETGKPIWEFEYASDYQDLYGYDPGPRVSPLVDENRIYLYGVEGLLHCLDIATGKQVWSCDTLEKFGVVQNFFGVGSAPIVFENLLLVMVGGSPPESQDVPPGALDRVASNGTGIVAFDKATGEVKYQVCDDLASYSSMQLHRLGDRTLAFAWLRSQLYCFDPATGAEEFSFPWRSRKLESVNAMTPIINAVGDVFLSDCYEKGSVLLRPVAGSDPEVVWSDAKRRDKSFRIHWNTPVLIDGYLYGCSGRHTSEGELRCVELKTGKVMWSQPGLNRTSVTAIDGHLIVMGERGTLQLVEANPKRFVPVTRWEPTDPDDALEYPAWAAAIVADGKMIVRGKSNVLCFQLIPQ